MEKNLLKLLNVNNKIIQKLFFLLIKLYNLKK